MSHLAADPSRLGTVEDVTGSRVSVRLSDDTAHGLVFVHGEGYRVGQVGSFVRIPAGYVDLFGIVAQVGAGAAPGPPEVAVLLGSRWLRVELVGEGRRGDKFQRGISQYPSIGDSVHVVTESDLRTIYAPGDAESHVALGRIASVEGVQAHLDMNRLVTRHSAVVGSTGAGKSTAVASLLAAISENAQFPAARILLLDLHGEYGKALADRASVFRLFPRAGAEHPLFVPYWALAFDELVSVCFGNLEDRQRAVIADLTATLKKSAAAGISGLAIDPSEITADTPVPFNIRELWFKQHFREHRMVMKKQGGSEDEMVDAFVMADGVPEQPGDAESLTPPKFRTPKTTGNKESHVISANEGAGLRLQLASLHSKLRDPRFAFLFAPGEWNPDERGQTRADLDRLLAMWLCAERPMTILDLSGIPSSVLDDLIGVLLRVVFDAAFWGRHLPQGGRQRPLLVVLEEAHVYLGTKGNAPVGRAAAATRRIAKEGRKYGVGVMLVSQRPSEIDSTILSQCGTMIALRLTNEADRGQIRACSSDNLEGLFAMLPILRTGEALVVGEAVSMPMRVLIDLPPLARRPDSDDPLVVVPRGNDGKRLRPGGWTERLETDEYKPVVDAWRRQDPHAGLTPGDAASDKSKPEPEERP